VVITHWNSTFTNLPFKKAIPPVAAFPAARWALPPGLRLRHRRLPASRVLISGWRGSAKGCAPLTSGLSRKW